MEEELKMSIETIRKVLVKISERGVSALGLFRTVCSMNGKPSDCKLVNSLFNL
jgi:hypothetical protein